MRTITAGAAALLLCGCAASVDRSRAIDVERRWYGTAFTQDHRRLSFWSMMSALEAEDAARPHVQRFRRNVSRSEQVRERTPALLPGGAASPVP